MDLKKLINIIKFFRWNYIQIDYNLINDYIDFYTYKAHIEEDEILLNSLWCLKNIFIIKTDYVKTFAKLKHDKFYAAWCSFALIEERYKTLINIYDRKQDELDVNFIYDYTKKFQKFFPYTSFISPEFLVKKFKCSICGKTYYLKKRCNHKIGSLYNGKFCSKICLDIEILGSSIVKKPADKCTVIFVDGKDNFNYSSIKSLTSNLDSPFNEWDYTISKKLEPHSKFKNINKDEECPCGSGKKYGSCCLKKEGVLIDKFNVSFQLMPSKGKFEEYSEYYVQ